MSYYCNQRKLNVLSFCVEEDLGKDTVKLTTTKKNKKKYFIAINKDKLRKLT